MMVAIALLAMAEAATADNRGQVAMLAAGLCAVVAVTGLAVFETTVRRDRTGHHSTPRLLGDSYAPAPQWARVPVPHRFDSARR